MVRADWTTTSGSIKLRRVVGDEDTAWTRSRSWRQPPIWLLVIGAALMRVPGGSMRSLIAPWLAFTLLTMAVEFIVFNIAWFGLLFFVGKEQALSASS